MRTFATFILLIVMSSSAMAITPTEKGRINYLLDQLAASHATFIRNGEEHNAAWGKMHLEQKLAKANKPDMTADDFIANIASTSSHTGKPYLIKTSDGKTVEAGSWFKAKLALIPLT